MNLGRSEADVFDQGQRDILTSLITFAKNQEHRAIQLAREAGVEIVFEGD